MIDFEKEEFLRRLDLRVSAISSMLAYHEKMVANLVVKPSKYREVEECIDKAHRGFMEFIQEHDNKIREFFAKEIAKENDNSGN